MKTLRLIPLVVTLAACSSVNIPMSPYRIDVQQGNALEQEAVDKLKVGMTSAQVRFLLGTPLLVDPFRNNRWDYVYNYRKAGKLTEQRRLALYFDGEVLVRIGADGVTPKAPSEQGKVLAVKAENKPISVAEAPKVITPVVAVEPIKPVPVVAAVTASPPVPVPVELPAAPKAVAETAMPVKTLIAEAPKAASPATLPPEPVKSLPAVVAAVASPAAPKAEIEVAKPVAAAVSSIPLAVAAKIASPERNLNETSIVSPMTTLSTGGSGKPVVAAAVSEKPPEPMGLQPETNVAAVVPDAVPVFKNAPGKAGSAEDQVIAALNDWANAWKSRDEDAYLAAYAASFRPPDGLTRAEWEKRRRLLLGLSRSIDLKIDGHTFELTTEDRAQISFRQFYRSDSYQDAAIKLIKFVRVDNLWLIEEEKTLAPIKVKK